MKMFLLCLDLISFILPFISMSEWQRSNLKTLLACVQLPQIFWQCSYYKGCLKKKTKFKKTSENKVENVEYVQNMSPVCNICSRNFIPIYAPSGSIVYHQSVWIIAKDQRQLTM